MIQPRLAPPRERPSPPAPDAAQRAVLDAVREADVVAVGEPGSGKSTTAVAAVVEAVARGIEPDRIVLLAPTRAAAARLRDAAALAVDRPVGAPIVRTPASLAFAILAAEASAHDEPPPSLIGGAEQDAVLRELLEGHLTGLAPGPDWAGIVPPQATALGAFREELRNLLMRAAEAGWGPADLADLGERTGRPEWGAAARVYEEYLDVVALKASPLDQGARYDPASVVATGARVLGDWYADDPAGARRWELVVVDDVHDATAATLELIAVLRAGGARIVAFGNADEAVQGYRGGLASAPALLATRIGAVELTLGPSHRQHGALAALTGSIAAHVGHVAGATARPAGADASGAPVELLQAPHRLGQSRAIAARLRRARHGLDGAPPVPWERMAVIARSAAALRELRADLAAADIPCEALGDGTALHVAPAVSPLLTILDVATGAAWSEESAVGVLGSRLGGLDPVALRRLRRALVRAEREGGGTRTSADLLVEALDTGTWGALGGDEARRAARISTAVAAARSRAASPGATPGAVLWAAWSALGLADAWRAAALAGSARDDADLDAIIALLKAAQLFAERLPHASVRQLLDYLESQEFAADSLGARGARTDVVAFATPASAAGREWDVVVIAGLEEGAWPNTRLRDSVLGAGHLADILAGRAPAEAVEPESRAARTRAARAAVLDDEARALVVAVSRARRSVVATCAPGEDARPSRYLAWLADAAGVQVQDAIRERTVADLRGAVAHLRTEGQRASGPARSAHAQMLAHLADLGVPGARPEDWHGVPEPSTGEPFWPDDAPVRVSPSKVESVETCALRWALETQGGSRESTMRQQVGTLIHEIAAEHPRATVETLLAALDERWDEVGSRDTWTARNEYEKAREMVRKLGQYLAGRTAADVRVEQGFRVEVGRARLSGQADRVEIENGVARIADLKTGAGSGVVAEENPQLEMYQLAAALGAFEGVSGVAGAELVYVGEHGRRSPKVLGQAAVDPARAVDRLSATVDTMTDRTFLATAPSRANCDTCPVRRACPAHVEGRQVSDG